QQPVVYSCWLRDEGKPTVLFDAACDHVGYVAANLAVRWHPDGNHLLYIKQTEPGQHGLFEFDLKTKTSRSVFALTATALIFDWAPDKTHLVCVLGSMGNPNPNDGIWIGKPGAVSWWHVPQSQALCQGELPSLLEQLRATRPAWTADAGRIAFVSYRPAPT